MGWFGKVLPLLQPQLQPQVGEQWLMICISMVKRCVMIVVMSNITRWGTSLCTGWFGNTPVFVFEGSDELIPHLDIPASSSQSFFQFLPGASDITHCRCRTTHFQTGWSSVMSWFINLMNILTHYSYIYHKPELIQPQKKAATYLVGTPSHYPFHEIFHHKHHHFP